MIGPAAEPPALVYQHPGADPYRGTFGHAIALLGGALGIDPGALAAIETAGYCRTRAWRQGEVADAMVYGRGRVARGVYLDIAAWPANASRLIVECTDGRGVALIEPVGCGNWAVEFVPPFPFWDTPPPGGGWTPAAWGIPEGDTGGYGYGWGGGAGGFFPGTPGFFPGTPGNIIPASLETGSSGTPQLAEMPGEFETPETGTPGAPGGSVPPVMPPTKTPPGSTVSEPSGFAILSLLLGVFFVLRRRLR